MTVNSVEKVFTRKETGEETSAEGGQKPLFGYADYDFRSNVPVDWVLPWDKNPRKEFDTASLAELAESIATHGVQQNLVVRVLLSPVPEHPNAQVQIVMGDRRWRAAKLAGLTTIPCIVRVGLSDKDALALAVVENLQRRDLNAMEQAQSYAAMVAEGWKQVEIAQQVGVSEAVISNALRLLRLPEGVQMMVSDGRLQASHARALLRFEGFDAAIEFIAQKAIEGNVSARSLESSVPFFHEMDAKKIVRAFSATALPFDIETNCKVCPYNAYRTTDNWANVCLRPEHYKQLEREAEQAKQNRLAAYHEQQRQQQADEEAKEGVATGTIAPEQADEEAEEAETDRTTTERTRPDVSGLLKRFPAPDPAVLQYGDLQAGDYVRLDTAGIPDECSAACPCRAMMQYKDGLITPICTDFERCATLRDNARKRKRAECKARFAAQWEEFLASRQDGPPIETDVRALTLLLAHDLQYVAKEVRDDVGPTVGLGSATEATFPVSLRSYMMPENIAIWEELATTLTAPALEEYALRCLMGKAFQLAERDGREKVDAFEWYMERAEIPVAPTELVPIEGGEQDEDEADFYCARCNAAIADDLLGSPLVSQKVYAVNEADESAWTALRLESGVLVFDYADIVTTGFAVETESRDDIAACEFAYCPTCAPDVAICCVCGCTDERGCEGGCSWVEPGLCSECIDRAVPNAAPVAVTFLAGQRVAVKMLNEHGSVGATEWQTGVVSACERPGGHIGILLEGDPAPTFHNPDDVRLLDVQTTPELVADEWEYPMCRACNTTPVSGGRTLCATCGPLTASEPEKAGAALCNL